MGCMCMECKFTRIIQDEKGDLLCVCANRKSDNWLTEISLAFDNCEVGMLEDDDEGE